MKFFITGTRRGLGKALADKYGNCGSLEECDIFINCKHDGFDQVELLYKAMKLGKRTINIGSFASDWTYLPSNAFYKYSIEKKALRDASSQFFNHGYETTCVNFGYIDTESQEGKDVPKMSVDYVVGVIDWVLEQPHKVKDITVCP